MDHGQHFHKVAVALSQAQRNRGVKTLIVASAAPGEGKSHTAATLARVLAGSFMRRVLLIDADLRRPVLHTMHNVANDFGLDDLLRGAGDVSQLPTRQIGPNLELLTAGRVNPDPIGALTSPRMQELLASAATRFDWILVDTPPVALLPDSELLGSIVDGAVLVVGAGETDYRLITKAADALGRERILGVGTEQGGSHGSGRPLRRIRARIPVVRRRDFHNEPRSCF